MLTSRRIAAALASRATSSTTAPAATCRGRCGRCGRRWRAVGAALGPVAARLVVAGRERRAVRLRAGQDVVLVRRVAAAVDDLALFGERGLLGEVVGAVQLRDVLGDDDALGVLPRAAADAILGVDGAARPCVLQVGVPRLAAAPPAAAASVWQYLSAPSRPPKSAPLPAPVLVTKNVMAAGWAAAVPIAAKVSSAARPILLRVMAVSSWKLFVVDREFARRPWQGPLAASDSRRLTAAPERYSVRGNGGTTASTAWRRRASAAPRARRTASRSRCPSSPAPAWR